MLIELDKAGSIVGATKGDFNKSTGYSRNLRELSVFFGVELTRREGKTLGLTPAGAELARLVREHFHALAGFQSRWAAAPANYVIAADESLLQWLVAPRLQALMQAKAKVVYELRNRQPPDIIRGLQEMSLDFGIVPANAVPATLKQHPLGALAYAIYLPKGLWRKSSRPLAILANVPMALHTSGGPFEQLAFALAKAYRVKLDVRLRCESFPQACNALRTGQFATILPTLVDPAWYSEPEVQVIPLNQFENVSSPLVLAWNPRMVEVRPEAAHLLEILSAALPLTQRTKAKT